MPVAFLTRFDLATDIGVIQVRLNSTHRFKDRLNNHRRHYLGRLVWRKFPADIQLRCWKSDQLVERRRDGFLRLLDE
jgi:hypothetical protein